ncbi:MAG: hypothetical protein HY537_14085 [Deltaproteobacteria bacterium]|nr:hypothetical protein [Deltaproteobacteria bacterium]
MNIDFIDFNEQPKGIISEPVDMIWVWLKNRPIPSPISSPALECVDWQMQGAISEFVLRGEGRVFIPTFRKIRSPYLVLEKDGSLDAAAFMKVCEGLRVEKVLGVFEEYGKVQQIRKEWAVQPGQYPKNLLLAADRREAVEAFV